MSFRRFSGLDEAALGPRLGPFCATLTSISFSEEHPVDRDLYQVFNAFITREREDSRRIAVADSKKIHSGTAGFRVLEENVVPFLGAAGLHFPCSFPDFLRQLCPEEDMTGLSGSPWFQNCAGFILPAVCGTDTTAESTGRIKTGLERCGAVFDTPLLRFVTARSFNGELASAGGKGPAVRNLLTPLLRRALVEHPPRESRITVDRQGGRRYYGAWLSEIFPGWPLRAREEGRHVSVYSVGGQRLEFLVRADDLRMETALASMIAKYTREIAMKIFNAWWLERIPGIRPTAGYPQDASRFISDVTKSGLMPDDVDILIRRL